MVEHLDYRIDSCSKGQRFESVSSSLMNKKKEIMNIISYICYLFLAFQVFRLIKFEIRHRKRMKILKGKWIEICKISEKQQKEYFEMMETDNGLRTAYNNAYKTVFNN